MKQLVNISNGAPSNPPEAPGLINIDENNGDVYIARTINGELTWGDALGSGGGGNTLPVTTIVCETNGNYETIAYLDDPFYFGKHIRVRYDNQMNPPSNNAIIVSLDWVLEGFAAQDQQFRIVNDSGHELMIRRGGDAYVFVSGWRSLDMVYIPRDGVVTGAFEPDNSGEGWQIRLFGDLSEYVTG